MQKFILAAGLLLPAAAAAQSPVPAAQFTLTGAPTAPTAPLGTNSNQIATTAFVMANQAAAATPVTAPISDMSTATIGLPGLPARSLQSRAADIYNVKDYGALGTNNGVTIGSQFPSSATASLAAFAVQTANGSTPYAWMTNPAFGLTFSMPTSTDQGGPGTGLKFLESLTGINGWSATVAAWQDPLHGNYLLQPGMQVSGTCIAAGTTLSSVDRTPNDAAYGTITLSKATQSDCASGSVITFTIAPGQLQALTSDWLGIQGAMAAAWMNAAAGGSVYMPAGNYIINRSLINAGGVTDSNVELPNLDVHGDGVAVTRLQFPTDLGTDACAMSEATRGEPDSSFSTYHDFRILGPNTPTRTNGIAPNKMDGLCIGAGARAYGTNIEGMHAGINGIKDHWLLHDVTLTNNGYGIYFAPYTSTIGNQSVTDSSIGGDLIAGFGVSTTNQIDSSTFSNVHTGFGPYGFYREPLASNVRIPLGFLSNSVLTNVWIEAVGNAWIYGAGAAGGVSGNTFIGGQYSDVGAQKTYALPAGSGQTMPAPAVIYAQSFDNNTMINTNWSPYSHITDAVIETSNECSGDSWINDPLFVSSATQAVPALKCAINLNRVTFSNAAGTGFFSHFGGGNAIAGMAVFDAGYTFVLPFQDGRAFAGITASPASANAAVGVITAADQLQNVIKADPNQSIALGQPVFATTGGIAGGLDNKGAIGAAYPSAPGSSGVVVDLNPAMKAGANGAASGLSAMGTTQASATLVPSAVAQFTNVASGQGTILAIVPIGEQITVFNDAPNALRVYPPVGSRIGSNAVNAAISIAPGTSATFRRLSTTLWHQ